MALKEIIKLANDRIDQAKHQQRLERKHARDMQRRKNQRRNYAVGELVIKHFPELLRIEPGTKAENVMRFAPLEAFLAELAADQELIEQIKARPHLGPQHVSGHREKKGDRPMANYHLEIRTISRGKGQSVARRINYISGQRMHDSYTKRTYYDRRHDILYCKIFQPDNAPSDFHNLQTLCDEIERAEHRYDARTAREFVGSLPNELPTHELISIVRDFIERNFLERGLCAIAAIHEGQNKTDPSRNNPHVHIVVPTRTVGPDGFCTKKYQEHNKRKYIDIWREQWALAQNQAYEQNGLGIRVNHESLEVQGIRDREPTIHLSHIVLQREGRGGRMRSSDRKRKMEERNRERNAERKHQRRLERERERELRFSR